MGGYITVANVFWGFSSCCVEALDLVNIAEEAGGGSLVRCDVEA